MRSSIGATEIGTPESPQTPRPTRVLRSRKAPRCTPRSCHDPDAKDPSILFPCLANVGAEPRHSLAAPAPTAPARCWAAPSGCRIVS